MSADFALLHAGGVGDASLGGLMRYIYLECRPFEPIIPRYDNPPPPSSGLRNYRLLASHCQWRPDFPSSDHHDTNQRARSEGLH